MSALSLLYSSYGSPNFRSRSRYDRFLQLATSLVALLWTFSMISLSFLYRGKGGGADRDGVLNVRPNN